MKGLGVGVVLLLVLAVAWWAVISEQRSVNSKQLSVNSNQCMVKYKARSMTQLPN